MKRLAPEKRALVISLLTEGTPINAVCRILHVGKHAVLRVIRETGAALADYMNREFRNIRCERLALDEQWQYVGMHGQRMFKKEADRGDFWLWAGIDSDTKLIIGHMIGRRDWRTSEYFVEDIASRITGNVQIVSDPHPSYAGHVRAFFGERGEFTYAIDAKQFYDAREFHPETYPERRKNGIPKIAKSERKAVFGEPDLGSATTSHVERVFLTVRQELKRFQRLGLGYSKKLGMHKFATAIQIGIYNLCRRHLSLKGQTPAQAAGLADHRWSIEEVIALTDAYLKPREEKKAAARAAARRMAEDAVFLQAMKDLSQAGVRL